MKKWWVTVIFYCLASISFAQDSLLKLWYDKPAGGIWEAALPLGNGRLAAMVYGNTDSECIKLNESSVWSGGPNRNDNPNALGAMSEIRRLIFERNNTAAAKLASEKVQSERINGMMFQPVGDLHLEFPGHQKFENYYRELNLEDAVTKTKYTVDGVRFGREAFVSLTDQVIVIRLTADHPASLSFNAFLSSSQKSSVSGNGNDEII